MFCCFSWEKSTKCSQNPGLVNEFSATPRGRLNWTGPIANGSEKRRRLQIHQRAFKVFVEDPFAQYWCIDFGLLVEVRLKSCSLSRSCLKYVQSNSVPSWLLPNSCLQNHSRGPQSNRTSRFSHGSSKGKATKFVRSRGFSKLARFRNTDIFFFF